jgi:hypothetical protein
LVQPGGGLPRAAIADLKAGKPSFVGEVTGDTSKVITSKDTSLYDPSLETTDYRVEGIVGRVRFQNDFHSKAVLPPAAIAPGGRDRRATACDHSRASLVKFLPARHDAVSNVTPNE